MDYVRSTYTRPCYKVIDNIVIEGSISQLIVGKLQD